MAAGARNSLQHRASFGSQASFCGGVRGNLGLRECARGLPD